MADEDDYGDDGGSNEDYGEGEGGDEGDYGSEFESSPAKPAQPPLSSFDDGGADATMGSKETASTGALHMEMQQMANTRKEKMQRLDKDREAKKAPNDLTLEQ